MDKFFAILDMGTTNTRLTVTDSSCKVHYSVKREFGVKDRAATGSREILIKKLKQLTGEITQNTGISINQIEYMLCSGMITSEIGLIEIPFQTTAIAGDGFIVTPLPLVYGSQVVVSRHESRIKP